MNNMHLIRVILITLFTFHSSVLFAIDEVVINKMPQDLQDFLKVLMLARVG